MKVFITLSYIGLAARVDRVYSTKKQAEARIKTLKKYKPVGLNQTYHLIQKTVKGHRTRSYKLLFV